MMCIRKTYRFFIVCAALAVLMFASCTHDSRVKKLPLHNVVVIHSWDSIGGEKDGFKQCMDEEFLKQDLNVKVHHIYCNMSHRPPRVFANEDWDLVSDSIKRLNPEVILLNDDPIMECVLGGYIDGRDSVLINTPTVFAGVNALLRNNLKKYPKMTGFEEQIDLVKNLEVVSQITGSQTVVIEMDYDSIDMVLRSQLNTILADSVRFVNNQDFHVDHLDAKWLSTHYPGLMVVNYFSAGHPYTNHRPGEPDSVGKNMLFRAFENAKNTPQLQVKYDIFSNSIIDRSRKPQFTCIREQFDNPSRVRFLAGYFTSTRTQIEDQVYYASRIIKGEDPRSLPPSIHHNDYYMDWNAMQMYTPALSYYEYSGGSDSKIKFNIVNAPFQLEYPLRVALLFLFGLLVSGTLIYILVHYLSGWKKKGQQNLLDELTYEEKVHDLVFADSKDTLWHMVDNYVTLGENFAKYFKLPSNELSMAEVASYVHEQSLMSFDIIKNFRQQRGKKTVRLCMTPDGGKTWHWNEVTYTATDETARTGELYGLLLNIDRKKETEEKLEQAQILASEVALKENFLANISHDLRTPLGAVTGFSSLLATPGIPLEDEERSEYREIIHQNTDMILSMIDSVMQKAQIETGDLEIIQKPVEMSKLISETYQTNRIIAPTHLKFILETDAPDCMLNIDLTRTKQVVNNFLSNAFKFTAEGSVTLGWRHVPDSDQVEVYVKDTGIGVKPELQSQLFDRYVKVDETDRGTGLGLNISKTIMEKQSGTIGVESTFGKGSKFFFRLTKFVQCILLILTMTLGLLSTSSCSHINAPSRKANVIVIHGYDKSYPAYRQFNDDIHHGLLNYGIDPTIRHIYLDLDNPKANNTERYFHTCDSLKKSGWPADIILAEGDRTAHFLLSLDDNKIAKKSKTIPIILGALHHPEWDKIRQHKNMVAINDPIDYLANIELARKISKKNVIVIELDHFHQDSLIRQELRQAINSPAFIDNSDFHLQNVRSERFRNELKDSITILCYSTESPEFNGDTLLTVEQGYEKLGTIYTHSWQYPCLSLKKDMYSSAIVDKTGKPQFTAVKAGFADGEARYLCGYFAGYNTVAKDLAATASKILKGTDPTQLVGLTHEKHFYMDYAAMEAWGLEYKDYVDQFTIVGAPLEATAPVVHYGTLVLVGVVLLGGLLAVILIAQSWRERSINELVSNVKRRAYIRQLALHGADSRSVRTEDNVKEIISHIHPNYSSNIPLMMQSIDVAGTHSYDIYADIDQEGDYRWWQLRFVVMFGYETEKRVDGILINIDETMKHEADLRLAMHLAEEAKQKEDFLTTISHEIRTPLNAVVGFSDVMVSLPRESLSEDDLSNYGRIIKSNNTTLTSMIEDILMFSRIESGRIRYVKEEFKVSALIDEIMAEWSGMVPDGIELRSFCFSPYMMMRNDRARIKYIVNQLISNAIKFTKRGMVIVGVNYHLNEDMAEFFVQDSGCGIPKEKQQMVFTLFWKDNEFIPGLGLGLNVASKLAEGMDLTISLESKVNCGSKFSVFGKADLVYPDEQQPSQS